MNVNTTEQKLIRLTQQLTDGPVVGDQAFVQGRISYAQMYRMAAHIHHALKEVQAVCLCTQDKALVTAALISALAGGPRLILPYALTSHALEELQHLTGYSCAITDSVDVLPHGVGRFVPKMDVVDWPPAGSMKPIEPDAVWVRVFTGGSTGVPQSWPKTVRNLLAETIRIVDSYAMSAADCLVSTVSPLHIYGLLYAILAPWAASASVTDQSPSFPAEITTEVLAHPATILISVPAHYRVLCSHRGPALPLRLAFSSAGILCAEDALSFSDAHGIGVTEVYGSTETGGVASRNRFCGQDDFSPFEPVDLKIKSQDVWVRSAYLSPGLPLDSAGYYQIGDRAVHTEDNRFQLLGRSDSVVKVGGKRVDLEGIRQILKRHDRVEEVLVTSLPVGRSREQLIVALVQGNLDGQELSALMAETIEPSARPRRIIVVEKIPLTAAGKFDRRTIEAFFTDEEV